MLYNILIIGHCFGDKQAGTWIKFRKKKLPRTITYNNYTAQNEPLLNKLNLLKIKDILDLKILNFLFKLHHNELALTSIPIESILKKI